MLSIITCSINETKLKLLKNSLAETTTLPYELIVIENMANRFGICEAYNLGAKQSNFEYLCFVHEDIVFKNNGWDKNFVNHLSDKKISLVGILGNTIKTIFPSGVYSNIQSTNRINQIQILKSGTSIHYYNNPKDEETSEVATLDGMLLGTKKEYWNKIPFDDLTLSGFHGYDIDFSLSMMMLGKVIVVYDILVEHASFGVYTKEWLDNQIDIVKKWENFLPLQKGDTDSKTLKIREKDDFLQLTIKILNLRYPLHISIKYGLKSIIRYPFQRLNLFIIKNLTIRSLKLLKSII